MRKTSGTVYKLFLLLLVLSLSAVFYGQPVSAKSVRLNKKTVYLAKGGSTRLKVMGTKKKVKWKTGNKKIVTVTSNGKLKAKKVGTAKVIAKIGSKKLTCKVVVEKKAVHKARVLHNYVIRKGKYDKKTKSYTLRRKTDSADYGVIQTAITAYKSSYKMDFTYIFRPDSPESTTTTQLSINLITGKTSLKKGKATSNYYYVDEWSDDTYYGDITTAFDGKGKGLTLTKATFMVENYGEGGSPDPYYKTKKTESELKPYYDSMNTRLNVAFKNWNAMFAKKKELKKKGITMKSIGFHNWKK